MLLPGPDDEEIAKGFDIDEDDELEEEESKKLNDGEEDEGNSS